MPGKLEATNTCNAGSPAARLPRVTVGMICVPVLAVVQAFTCVKLPPQEIRCVLFDQDRLTLPCFRGVLRRLSPTAGYRHCNKVPALPPVQDGANVGAYPFH